MATATLLDHSLLYWGSGMSNGNAHDRSNPPAVLVGGAHGRLKGNRHIVAKKDKPTANLLLAMAHLAGAEIEKVGPSARSSIWRRPSVPDRTKARGRRCPSPFLLS